MIKQLLVLLVSFYFGFSSAAANSSIIRTEVRGSGHPMILIHGMACSAGVWDEVAAYYEDRYELHLVTLPGFGNAENIEAPHLLEAIRDAIID
ncbi:MAG: alpha/beta fold hydrolase, partial [Bacteroidota bacterium]